MAGHREDIPESAYDPQLNDVLKWGLRIGWWIIYPIGLGLYYALYYIAWACFFLVKLLYRPIEFIALPILHLGDFVLRCLGAPFRFAAKFETIYIYLGTAALTGIACGLLTTALFGFLRGLLKLDADADAEPAGRTAKQYREQTRMEKGKGRGPLMVGEGGALGYFGRLTSDGSGGGGEKGKRGHSLAKQTIMEELDSDD